MKSHVFKRLALVTLLIALFAALTVPALAQQTYPSNSITVLGFGQAYGDPDMATILLGVEVANTEVATAFAEVNETVENLIAVLKENGIVDEDIRTQNVSVFTDGGFQPMPMESTGEGPSRMFRVSNNLSVVVRDVDRVGEIIGLAIANGANNVYGPDFGISDPSALEQEARVNAIADARVRAQELADALGLTLGDPIIVVENVSGGIYFGPQFERAVGMGGGAAPIEAGQLSVSISVQITFSVG